MGGSRFFSWIFVLFVLWLGALLWIPPLNPYLRAIAKAPAVKVKRPTSGQAPSVPATDPSAPVRGETVPPVATSPPVLVPATGDFAPETGTRTEPGRGIPVVPPPTRPPVAGTAAPVVAEPGPILVQKRVGPEGGRVEAPGRVTVDFPPGALAAARNVTVRAGTRIGSFAASYDIDISGGPLQLKAPARVAMVVPPGVPEDKAVLLQEILPGLHVAVPSRFDRSTRVLEGTVSHFSNTAVAVSATTGATVTGLGWYGLAALGVLSPPGNIGLGAAAILAAGATVGGVFSDEAEDLVTRLRHRRRMKLRGSGSKAMTFELYWDGGDFGDQDDPTRTASGFTLCLDQDGRVVATVPGFHVRSDAVDYLQNVHKRSFDQIATVQFVPEGIARLTTLLDWIQLWYHQLYGFFPLPGYPKEGNLIVVVAPCGKNSAGEPNEGLWDGKYLSVDPSNLVGLVGDHRGRISDGQLAVLKNLAETLAHEYWHAIHLRLCPQEQNLVRSKGENHVPWLNECMARAFESEVFPACTGTFPKLTLGHMAARLGRGLGRVGSGDEAGELWPLGKFILHRESYGTRFVLECAFGRTDRTKLLEVLGGFVLSLLCRELALAPRMEIPGPGARMFVPTGWEPLHKSLGGLAPRLTTMGRTESVMSGAAFCFRNMAVEQSVVPRSLVVRREKVPCPQTLIALRPIGGSDAGPLRPAADLMRNDSGGLVVDPSWLVGSQKRFVQPLALATAGRMVAPDNALLAYYLAPPESPGFTLVEEETHEVTWAGNPDPMGRARPQSPTTALKPEQVYLGYRLFGRGPKTGEEPTRLLDLIFSDAPKEKLDVVLDPGGKGAGGAAMVKGIRPDARSVRLPRMVIGDHTRIGMATMDKVLRNDNDPGEPWLSPIQWSLSKDEPSLKMGAVTFRFPYVYTITGSVVWSAEDRTDAFDSRGIDDPAPLLWGGRTAKLRNTLHESEQESSITVDENLTKVETFSVRRSLKGDVTTFTCHDLPLIHRGEIGKTGKSILVFGFAGEKPEFEKYRLSFQSKVTKTVEEVDPKTQQKVQSTITSEILRLDNGRGGVVMMMSDLTDPMANELHAAGKLSERDLDEAMGKMREAMQRIVKKWQQ